MASRSLNRAYFEALYKNAEDPWSFATSEYESGKYARTLEALAGRRYRRGLEIGCSIGVFSALLAPSVESLLAVDVSRAALSRAAERCAPFPGVRFERMTVPAEFPAGHFDLIVLSEVGYYWDDADLGAAKDRIAQALEAGGDLELVHFLPKVDDYVRDGDSVHEAYLGDPRFLSVFSRREERYRLDVLRKASA